MSDAVQTIEEGALAHRTETGNFHALDKQADRSSVSVIWTNGLLAAGAWTLAAIVTLALPDVIPWGGTRLFAILVGVGAVLLALLSVSVHHLGAAGRTLFHYGPWFIALGLWFTFWELSTAKLGWLPKPFFSPPQGLLNVYVVDWQRLLLCILYTLRLWAIGFGSGVVIGYVIGIGLGWSKRFSYWGMPVLKLIGPVPATAWIPCTFFFFPTTFAASCFIVALASGIPVAILTASGVGSVNRAYYDVGRILGAKNWYLIRQIAIPASLPHVFVGLFMGLYYSFAVLVVAEMLGAKYGLGWYIQFQTAYSAYANVYAALLIMAFLCASIVRLLFLSRDRLLGWQKGFI
jgi:NitT/TauT family transport system permease protein